jgi:hypothetical protein
MNQPYWVRHPDGPFATLIAVATTYLHPEADDLESLQELARLGDRPEMLAFKAELRQAITCPGQVPRAELSSHVQYDDGSPEKFLQRLWRELYGDEPVSPPRQGGSRMTVPQELDSVRSTAAAKSDYDDRTIPAGMTGAVLSTWPDGAILIEFAFTPQTADTDGDFVQGILTDGPYEIIEDWPAGCAQRA